MSKLLVSFLLFLVLPLSAIAQERDASSPVVIDEEKNQAVLRIMVEPIMRIMFDEGADRSGVLIAFVIDAPIPIVPALKNIKEEFGMTDEQRYQFHKSMSALAQEMGEPEIIKVLQKSIDENSNYVPTEDEIAEIESLYRLVFEQMNTAAAEAFSEEQMQRLDNMVFAITGGLQSLLLSEKHMDALEMTDEQKAQFKKINEETQPEREKMIAAFDAEIQKMVKTGNISVNNVLRALSKFRELGLMLKQRRSEVLTREQLAKAREMAKLPKSMTFSVFDVLPKWAPGPNSWKPGDPLPVEVKPMPPGRFPRGENQSP